MKRALLLALLAVPTATPAETNAESRAEAIARTRREILSRIERHGGRDAIRAALGPFREEVHRILQREADSGTHTFQQGKNRFGKAISESAIEPEWRHEWDASRGELPARDVIVDFDRKLRAIGVDLIVVPVPRQDRGLCPRVRGGDRRPGSRSGLSRLDEML